MIPISKISWLVLPASTVDDSIAGMEKELSDRAVLLRFATVDEFRKLMHEITLLRHNIEAMKEQQSKQLSLF